MTGIQQPQKMVQKNLKLRQDQDEWLQKKKDAGFNTSQLIRIALDKLIEEKEKKE